MPVFGELLFARFLWAYLDIFSPKKAPEFPVFQMDEGTMEITENSAAIWLLS
jgi:hypothetical protein